MSRVPDNDARNVTTQTRRGPKGIPKRATARLRATVEAYCTVTTAKSPRSLWTFIYGRSLGSAEIHL